MKHKNSQSSSLFLGAVGVVYGDIGTSPLYAFKKCFSEGNIPLTEMNIVGITSLVCWFLFLIVSIKYVSLILQADNHGEGGILSLASLCSSLKKRKLQKLFMFLGVLGTSLFYGDGVITPAISVLSALEGLSLVSHQFDLFIPLLATIIVFFLFLFQKKGSEKIGLFFGPMMVIWFSVLAFLGALCLWKSPLILKAINPFYGVSFLISHGKSSLFVMGSVVLAITGAEALYADMGHFGRGVIKKSWFYLVFPSLILNYLGQGALLLDTPAFIENPFYRMCPPWALTFLIFLSTLATIIASQAVISGVFSMAWQGILLGYLPRMNVIHTSSRQIGQVYVPFMNYALMFLTILAIHFFRNSENLAEAYGITVTGIMVITTFLGMFFALYGWKWGLLKTSCVFIPFLLIDGFFLFCNIGKISGGGWFSISITLAMYLIIRTWRKGRHLLSHEAHHLTKDFPAFLKETLKKSKKRIPGTAIFMSRTLEGIPASLLIHLEHYKFLFEKTIFLSIVIQEIPKVSPKDFIEINTLGHNLYQIKASHGFVEVPNFYHIIEKVREKGVEVDYHNTSFILTKGLPFLSSSSHLSLWEEKLFIFLSHNSSNPTEFYKIPHHRVVELGIHFKA